LPHRSHAPALVWLPDDAWVRTGAEGFLDALEVNDGQQVQPGQVIARLHNDPLRTRWQTASAAVERLRIEHVLKLQSDPLMATRLADRLGALQAEAARLEAQVDALTVRAARAGRLVLDPQQVRLGAFVPQGFTLAQVLPDTGPVVHAFVHNDDITAATARDGRVWVSLPQDGGDWPAERVASVPQASTRLPSPALGQSQGGLIVLNPLDRDGLTAAEPRLRVDLQLPADAPAAVGVRALVTFDLGHATAAEMALGVLRKLFLRHLSP